MVLVQLVWDFSGAFCTFAASLLCFSCFIACLLTLLELPCRILAELLRGMRIDPDE